MQRSALELDHDKSNPLFASWKLSKNIVVCRQVASLEGPVITPEHSTEYLSTRAAVLHNHISSQFGRLYVFCKVANKVVLCSVSLGHGNKLKTVWELPQATAEGSQTAALAPTCNQPLQPSIVEIRGSLSGQSEHLLLVSTGQGDVTLINSAQPVSNARPCFPLRQGASKQDAQSLHLEAAQHTTSGQIELIAWAIRLKSGAHAAGCQVFCITLAYQDGTLEVNATQLLQVCAMPPHSVSQPNQNTVSLATAEPVICQVEEEVGQDLSCAQGGSDSNNFGDDMSPRTLRQAAERLARFTSDQPPDALQQNEFADLYSEVGPDNVGGMGDEPSCTLTLYCRPLTEAQHSQEAIPLAAAPPTGPATPADLPATPIDPHATPTDPPAAAETSAASALGRPHLSAAPSSQDTASIAENGQQTADADAGTLTSPAAKPGHDAAAADGAEGPLAASHGDAAVFEAVMQIGCSPHNVVASQAGQQQPMLLGLSNDVDCAVLAVTADGRQLQTQHAHSIPALAYVAAGKVHKKFVLLGHPESALAAAIVEGHRFSYVYRKTSKRQGSGESQIIDMGLPQESDAVLGAALHWHHGQDSLLILTAIQLHVYSIRFL